jgi:uncharacterized LabA/DUF88 family protein
LIDFASVVPSPKSAADTADALELTNAIVRRVVRDRIHAGDAIHETRCRLYGGWFDINGSPLQQHGWLLAGLRGFGGLDKGVRIVGEVADTLACHPSARLVGTYKNQGQKMVDAMMSLDALFFARSGNHRSLLIVSDDDDFVPVTIAVTRETSTTVCWLRQREQSHNDHQLSSEAVELLTDTRWT